MKNNSANIVSFILYISLFMTFIFLYSENPGNHSLIIVLSGTFTIIEVVRYNIQSRISTHMIALLFSIQFSLAFIVQIVDGSFVPQIYFFILLAETAYYYRLAVSIPFTIAAYLAFSAGVYIHLDSPSFQEISFVIPRMLEYGLIFGFSYMAKRSNEQRILLENAYQQLQKATNELEEKTIIDERVKLSREIHDTIGFTLTSTIVGLETVKQLSANNFHDKAKSKLTIVQGQVRESLNSIRELTTTLHYYPNFIDFKKRLIDLIENAIIHSDIIVTYTIADIENLTPDQNLAIYRGLQEGLTNGIKHGGATEFSFFLKKIDSKVIFRLTDNGQLKKDIRYGLGLTAMYERIISVNGKMNIRRTVHGGCELSFSIPIELKRREVTG
ncbi:sensor histidine kinase [Virgibacillus doumboii]|uniref:sensor histidine kinase n=1 Tax=Virgibacillus doumboii TaxID=2697503 RepID=UPI0013DF5431|nr:histidine kinase [Virgibacillus doumboii]